MHSTSLKIEHTDKKKIIKIHTMYIKWMPIFFYGKEFTNIGSIGIKDKKKKASRITNIKCKLGEGGRGWRFGD